MYTFVLYNYITIFGLRVNNVFLQFGVRFCFYFICCPSIENASRETRPDESVQILQYGIRTLLRGNYDDQSFNVDLPNRLFSNAFIRHGFETYNII